jgi:hypothetical protein
VKPSAILELGWALYRIKRAWQFDEPAALCRSVEPPAYLARRVAEFWSDAARNFDELFVLAQWGGALFETNPSRLFSRLRDILETASSMLSGMASGGSPFRQRARTGEHGSRRGSH